MDCECLLKCPFFNDKMPIDSAIGTMYKKKYCLDKNDLCARHRVFKALGRESVPVNMFPNQNDVADKILKEAGKL